MARTKLLLEKFHWEASKDKSHQYYVCEPDNQAEFKNLVTHIKRHGYIVTIQGMPYFSVDIGRYLYWTNWDGAEKINIINRMPIGQDWAGSFITKIQNITVLVIDFIV
jgi:hypothetical protein